MKLALAQIDMRLGDIEGICGRIEDQARLAHERGARVLCVPAPLFMGAMPGGLVGAADFEHDMLAGLNMEQKSQSLVITDRREAIKTACALAQPGDVVLVAGKGHEDYQIVKGVKHHFDDREEVKKATGMI